MSPRMVEKSQVLVMVVTMLCYGALAQSGCTTSIMGLSPCLNYITGNSSTPSSSCCSQLGSVVQSSPQCLCSLLNGGGASFGLNINQTLALALPGACNVQTPSVSQCNAAGGPTSPSATSPVASPPSSDGSTDTPDSGIAPSSQSDVPSGTGSGSKTTDGGSSSASGTIKAPLQFVLFFIVFVASTISKF